MASDLSLISEWYSTGHSINESDCAYLALHLCMQPQEIFMIGCFPTAVWPTILDDIDFNLVHFCFYLHQLYHFSRLLLIICIITFHPRGRCLALIAHAHSLRIALGTSRTDQWTELTTGTLGSLAHQWGSTTNRWLVTL